MLRNVQQIHRPFVIVTVLLLFVTSLSLFFAATAAGAGYAPFQETGTINISIGSGTGTSINTSTSTSTSASSRNGGGGGGGGYVSCTVSLGYFSCATSSTSGGITTSTAMTTQTGAETTETTLTGDTLTGVGGGNATVTSTTSSVPEFRTAPILLAAAIGLALLISRQGQKSAAGEK